MEMYNVEVTVVVLRTHFYSLHWSSNNWWAIIWKYSTFTCLWIMHLSIVMLFWIIILKNSFRFSHRFIERKPIIPYLYLCYNNFCEPLLLSEHDLTCTYDITCCTSCHRLLLQISYIIVIELTLSNYRCK